MRIAVEAGRRPPKPSKEILGLIRSALRTVHDSVRRQLPIPGLSGESLVGAAEVDAAIKEATALIRAIPKYVREDVRKVLKENIGTDRARLAKLLKERADISQRRAEFWARDQTLKAHAAVTESRSKSAGFPGYRWVTSKDQRVRDAHGDNEGRYFRWDDPPPTGHPGHEPNCRCNTYPATEAELKKAGV